MGHALGCGGMGCGAMSFAAPVRRASTSGIVGAGWAATAVLMILGSDA